MSRRKQTKPFKVEDKEVKVKREKIRSRRSTRDSESVENLAEVDGSEVDDDATVRMRSYTKCDECGKTLASSLSLARHKLTHSENKPYRCPHCNAGFKTSSNMHRHVRIHFRENYTDQTDAEPVLSKPRLPVTNQRSPRLNIRTPNKFREFDVDLVGIGPRTSEIPALPQSKAKSNGIKEEFQDLGIHNSSEIMKSEDTQDDDQEDYNNQSDSEPPPKAEDLVCHICSKTFISRFGLLTHTVAHNEREDISDPLRCYICYQSFATSRGLMMHNVVEHKISKDKVKVKESEELFQKMAELDFSAVKFPYLAEKACTRLRHRSLVQDSDHTFHCKKCDVSFPLLEALRIHMRDKHWGSEKVTKPTLFSSINLAKKTDLLSSKDKLEIINGIDDDIMYTSKLLSFKCIPQWFQDHPDDDLSAYDKGSSDEMIPYTSKLVLFDGMNQEQDVMSDKNTIDSNSNSAMKRKLRNQVDSSSILRRFECTVPRKLDVNKIPGEKNVFWCKICNYSSHEKSALVRHLLTHSGIRPYFCKICDYAFTTKANCERHVRKRHKCISREDLDAAVRCDWELLKKAPREDIYMISASNSCCPVCQESFSCNNELKLHMKTHEERHFVCQLCGVRCTTRNNCVRHILHKHPGIPHLEANNIITFRGNGPNDLDLDIEAMTTDGTEDSSDVDISRGRLGLRSNAKQSTHWKKPTIQRRPNIRQSLSKRPRLEKLDPSKCTPEPSSRESPNQEDENKIEDDLGSNVGNFRSNKVIPLIPLLKIKAYNEAAAKSYAQMVALYEHLNFLNPISQNNNNLLDVAAALNQTMDEPLNEADGEAYFASETTFICRTCAKAFDSKELLENHVPHCEYIANDEVADNYQDPNEMEFAAQQNENGLPEETEMEYNENLAENEWDQRNEDGMTNDTANGGVDSKGNEFLNWQENTDENSYNAKSSEESVSAQEYDSAYGSDKLRGGTYGKEPSYVEDSLLMSMFGEEEDAEHKVKSVNSVPTASMPRYSSDLPTMVGVTSGSASNVNYQGSLDGDDKASVKRNYHGRQCPQCNKTFPWASSLRRHIMTHTGLKLYMCRVCKMRFTTRSNLIRHVYRRHGMAKQHPDFASCLAKLNPSDSLLREVEADVRRRIDKRKRIPGTRNAYERLEVEDEDDDENSGSRKVGIRFNNFQSMLEDDPETMLVDLDYSPRDELNGFDELKQFQDSGEQQDEPESQEEEYREKKQKNVGKDTATIKTETENPYTKEVADTEITGGNENNEMTEDASDVDFDPKIEKKQTKCVKNSRNKQSSHFVCGLCKKIFKTVDELISHLDVHNIPHCWHCPICRVPFTNKYNCQRHLSRRHTRADLEPKYVEDSKHGPRNARGLPKSSRTSPDWKPKKANAHTV